jgi:hypothetical protein
MKNISHWYTQMARFTLLLAICVVASAPAFGQNILVNGSFESGGPIGSPGFNTTTTLTGWNVVQNNVNVVTVGSASGLWLAPASDGSNVLDLSGDDRAIISQQFTTTLDKFNLTFNFSRNLSFVGTGTFTGQVLIYDSDTETNYLNETFTRTVPDGANASTTFAWSTFSMLGVSNGSSTNLTIEFLDLTNDTNIPSSQGIVLDNISFVPTPEPASIIGLSACCLAVGAAIRKKLKK